MKNRRTLDLLVHNFPENGVKFLLHHPLRELLAYLEALVDHFRKRREREELIRDFEGSIRTPLIRKEVSKMGRTSAEALREEGKLEGKLEGDQQRLLMLLRERFGRKVTPTVMASIQKTKDQGKLDEWFQKFVHAATFEEVGIPVKK